MTININGTNAAGQIPEATTLSNNSSASQLKEVVTDIPEENSNKTKDLQSTQEAPKTPARGLKGAILRLLEKIKNFFHRAPKQTPEQNQAQATELQNETAELQKQIQWNQRLSAELKALRQKLAEVQKRLKAFTADGAQKSERNLMQELDNTPSTFISQDLLSLLRNELPGQATSASGGVPPPPPPPPPPAPGGVPPPPPPPPVAGISKNSAAKPLLPKSGPNFLDVVSDCRKFLKEGCQIGEVTVYDKKSFDLEIQKLKTEIKENKADNEQKLEQIEKFQKDVRSEVDKLLNAIEESPNISAQELGFLRQRYNSAPELLLKEADKLKELKLMGDAQYGSLKKIRDGMDTIKEDLRANLEAYLNESKNIGKHEKEVNEFKLPLPDERKVPYLGEVLQLLTLEKELKGNPNLKGLLDEVVAFLSGNLTETAEKSRNEKALKDAEMIKSSEQARSKAINTFNEIRKNEKISIPYDDPKRMSDMLMKLKITGSPLFKPINEAYNVFVKSDKNLVKSDITEKSLLQEKIREVKTALRRADNNK